MTHLLVTQSCLFCDPMDSSLWGSSVHGVSQARILEWVAIPFSRGLSRPRDWTCISCTGRQVLYHLCHLGSPYIYIYIYIYMCVCVCVCVLFTQSCLTLCNPMDYSPPSSSVHGILQARILEWVAIPFSRGLSQPRDWNWVSWIAGRFFTIWAIYHIYTYVYF